MSEHVLAGASVAEDDVIVVPSAEVLALVRHDEPPFEPPEGLVPFVVPVVDDTGAADWYLTEDALAFGDVSLLPRFSEWRMEWERTWTLDPSSSLERLRLAAVAVGGSSGALEQVSRRSDWTNGWLLLEPQMQARVVAALARIRDLVNERGREGFGFVDASERRQPTGLARTWSAEGGPEVLAADGRVEVTMDPMAGLSVAMLDGSAELTDIVEVTVSERGVLATSAGGDLHLDHDDGKALAWLVPGATRWRVRRIPEAVVWAKTFAGLEECCRYATALGQPVRLTATRFFSGVDRVRT